MDGLEREGRLDLFLATTSKSTGIGPDEYHYIVVRKWLGLFMQLDY